MLLANIKRLRPGDEVFWTDPSGECSRTYVIHTIEYVGGIVKLEDKSGDYLECYARELS